MSVGLKQKCLKGSDVFDQIELFIQAMKEFSTQKKKEEKGIIEKRKESKVLQSNLRQMPCFKLNT